MDVYDFAKPRNPLCSCVIAFSLACDCFLDCVFRCAQQVVSELVSCVSSRLRARISRFSCSTRRGRIVRRRSCKSNLLEKFGSSVLDSSVLQIESDLIAEFFTAN